jgi:hypothetical protein
MRKIIIMLAGILLAANAAVAQVNPLDFSGYNTLGGGLARVFDPARFSMEQSFSMSYASSGRNSLLANTYRNTMNYRVGEKLSLQLDLAYSYLPSAFNRSSYRTGEGGQGMFLPSFGLRYRPSQSFLIEFQYSSPGYHSGWPVSR